MLKVLDLTTSLVRVWRTTVWPILCLLGLGLYAGAAFAQSPRDVHTLDTGWRFIGQDVEAGSETSFDDARWEKVSVPHTFNAIAEGADSQRLYRGPTWYRKSFVLNASPATRTFIEFDGAYLATEVWLNGSRIGRHEGGYARFRFDLTAHLKAGRNQLAVKVDSTRLEHVAPLSGDFTHFGGIYRPVRLVTTRDIHFDMLDHGGPGVYVTPRNVTAQKAGINVTARIANASERDADVTVLVRLLKTGGVPVLILSQPVRVAAGTVMPVTLSGSVTDPHLWQGVNDPYLYTTRVEIMNSADAAVAYDRLDIATGLRDIRIDPDQGLLLNGKPYSLHGPNLHLSMRPGKTVAVSEAEIAEDIRLFEEMGATGLRLAHYQHGPSPYDIADAKGLLLWTETPLVSEIRGSEAFIANASQQLRELIRQNYNHPSVFMWGLGNEIYKVDADSARVLSAMQALAHQEDPTRPTAYANCCGAIDHPQAMHTDLVASNVYFGWYSGEFDALGPWLDSNHKTRPVTPQGVSEYGAGGSIHHQQDPPRRPATTDLWHPEQYQTLYHEAAWRQLRDRSWLWSKFIWVGFDFPSAGRHEGDRKGFNDKGLITYDRKTKKDAYYWYQANWTTKPMVYVTSRRFNVRQTSEVEVKVYSNQTSVVLRVNGVEQPAQPVTDHISIWKVALTPGRNRIEAVADTVSDTVEWIYQP